MGNLYDKWDTLVFDGDEGVITRAAVIPLEKSVLVGFMHAEQDSAAMIAVQGDKSVVIYTDTGAIAAQYGLESLLGFLKEVENRILESRARGKGWIK